ncbi:MAG: hypothetical protein EOO36_08120 [Cytophagaceae bacterium]|nr:MAG: hypothetical protein EOO36_08120 [Cytophagaceae bacterium]
MHYFWNYGAALLLSSAALPAGAQQPQFAVRNLSLPKELAYSDNQFSGLYIAQDKLFLMSESRLQDNAEAKLYTLKLADLDRKLADTAYVLPYQKLPIQNLAPLQAKMAAAGQSYEGLEAILVDKDVVYFSVETATPSTNCYLLKGRLQAAAVALDTTFLVPMAKPTAAGGTHIYNAGFEALALTDKHLLAFFEYNYFPGASYAYEFDRARLPRASAPRQLPLARLPFRLTDLTPTGGGHFTGINFFFKGDGGDAVYRVPTTDAENTRLTTDDAGLKNYARLLDITLTAKGFSWKPLWEFPPLYNGYNWEGIAAYQGGYFVLNDKYTPSRPYRSTLLYLQKTK